MTSSPWRMAALSGGLLSFLGACVQLLGDDFDVREGAGGGSTVGATGGSTAVGGSPSTGGGAPSTGGAGTGAGGVGGGGAGGGAIVCGGPGEPCCVSGVPCETLSCVAGVCPEVATLIQVDKPDPYTGTYGIDETEVTRAQYEGWLATNPTNSGPLLGPGCSGNASFVPAASCMGLVQVCTGANCGNHPQVCVDWCDAFAYCAAVGKKLCNHVESTLNSNALDENNAWVNACSSGGVNDYAPGSDDGDCRTGSYGTTQEVKASPGCQSPVPGYEGVYDLTGNVSEWIDGCEMGNDPNALCLTPGGYFESDYPYELCVFPEERERMSISYTVGFRCCEL